MATPPFPPNPNVPSGAKLPMPPPSGIAQKPIMPAGMVMPRETINIHAQEGSDLKTTQKKLKKETMRISLPPRPSGGQPMGAIPQNPLSPPPSLVAPTSSANKMMVSVTRPIDFAASEFKGQGFDTPTAAIPKPVAILQPKVVAPQTMPSTAAKPIAATAPLAPKAPPLAPSAPQAAIKPVVAMVASPMSKPSMPTVPIAPPSAPKAFLPPAAPNTAMPAASPSTANLTGKAPALPFAKPAIPAALAMPAAPRPPAAPIPPTESVAQAVAPKPQVGTYAPSEPAKQAPAFVSPKTSVIGIPSPTVKPTPALASTPAPISAGAAPKAPFPVAAPIGTPKPPTAGLSKGVGQIANKQPLGSTPVKTTTTNSAPVSTPSPAFTYTAPSQAEGGAGLPIAAAVAALISVAVQVLSLLNVI